MSVEVILDKEDTSPTIVELSPVIPNITDKTIKVRWANTKDEIHTLRQFQRDFLLCVPDVPTFDKTVAAFGKRLKIPQSVLERAKLVLTDRKGYNWRNFVEEQRENISPKHLLLKLAADAIRKGNQPSLAEIVKGVFADGINPADTDVLIRLKSSSMRG